MADDDSTPVSERFAFTDYWNVNGDRMRYSRDAFTPFTGRPSPLSLDEASPLGRMAYNLNETILKTADPLSNTTRDTRFRARVTRVEAPKALSVWVDKFTGEAGNAGIISWLPELRELLVTDAEGNAGAGAIMLPIVYARIELLMPMYPRPRTRGCGVPFLGARVSQPLDSQQFMFISVPTRGTGGEWKYVTKVDVGDVISVSFDKGLWSSGVGYLERVILSASVSGYDAEQVCTDTQASSASENGAEPSTLTQEQIAENQAKAENLAAASKEKEEEKERELGPEGQKAVLRGGVSEFLGNFWGSSSDTKIFTTSEEADAAREKKPSKQ